MTAPREDGRLGGWWFRPDIEVTKPLDVSMQLPVATDAEPVELHLVFTDDGLYVPAILRRPPGDGPHPAVIGLHGGSGGLGIAWLLDFVRNRGYVVERFLDAGYAVCFTEGRMETEEAYQLEPNDATTPPIPAVLDHHDVIATYEYLRELPGIDGDRIGFFGVSHGGELQMKVITELESGPAALAPMEPAVIEYLELRYHGERTFENLQFNDRFDDERIHLGNAMDRIAAIDDSVPILVGGRDDDHLQGAFYKLYELLDRAGKRAEWVSWDHPDHAFHWGPRRSEAVTGYEGSNWTGVESTYDVDAVTKAAIDRVIDFLNDNVRDR